MFTVKQTPTADDNKSATVCQNEPTARKYKKCLVIVSAELTDMRRSVIWVTLCLGNVRWMDGYR